MRLSHHHDTTTARYRPGQERGYVLVMFALLLVPLLLITGFAVDVGYWYNRASDMRKAADAAALAGVVWLPDVPTARAHALEAASANGFVNGEGVTIQVEAASAQRIKVTITDEMVGSFLWGSLGGNDIGMTRTAYAEYILPVPLGSPRNFIGTGLLMEPAGTGFENEELYMAVNPYCTDKVNGDRYQSMSDGGPSSGGGSQCVGSANKDYRSTGYETVIQAPPGRSSNIDVLLYDARYNWSEDTGVVDRTCGTVTEMSPWVDVPSNGSRNYSLPTRGEEQRMNYFWGFEIGWGNVTARAAGNYNVPSGRYRYRYEVTREVCETRQISESAIDRQLGNTRTEPFTFTLFGPDDTVFDQTDNPVICSKTFGTNEPFDYGPYLKSYRWNRLCSIPAGARSGDYVLRATNSANPSTKANGSNNYGVVARYANSTGFGLCDGRYEPTCPRVHGRDAISVQAASSASTAEFFLAEIDREHDGKFLRITLFDPGEGGQYIRIKRPTGRESWTPVSFTWESPGVSGSGETTDNMAVRVGTSDRFNGRVVQITVPLENYNPPADNEWWKIEYQFRDNFEVTDRTTWETEVVGDPVHLTEDVPQ